MRQSRVIFLFSLFLVIAMGCTAFKQYQDPRNIASDRRRQRNAFHRGSYFYPKRENYRGMLNSRGAPVSRVLQNSMKRQQALSYRQDLQKGSYGQPSNQQSALNSGVFVPKLPNHYTNLHKGKSIQNRRINQNLRPTKNFRPRNLPIFEQDEEGYEYTPFGIYKDSNAQMIFNSVMSDKKYPMMEPVPGQSLYPPTVPSFKMAPLRPEIISPNSRNSEKNRLTVSRINNHRMIPFYPHEAINPWSEQLTTSITTMRPFYAHIPYEENKILPISTSTPFPQIVYAIPYPVYSENLTTLGFVGKGSGENLQSSSTKTYKTYRAYWNKEDVSIKPVYEEQQDFVPTPTPSPKKSTEIMDSDQISPPTYLRNHRMETTTPLNTLTVDTFSTIVSSTERASPGEFWTNQNQQVSKKVLSSMQGGFKSCYPLHVYTLSKLLQTQRQKYEEDSKAGQQNLFQDLNLSPNNLLDSNEPTSDTKSFDREDVKETPKKARQVSNVLAAVPVQPNFNWIVMDHGYDLNIDRSQKYSSHYKGSALNPLSRKSIPKIHQSEAILGTQILVQR